MPKTIEASELPNLLKPGMRVFVAGGPNEPHSLIEALREAPEANAGVNYYQSIVPGMNSVDFASFHPEARITSTFMTSETQEAYREGRVEYIPMQLRVISDYLAETPVDVALMQFSDFDGERFSAGLNADYIDSIMANAKMIVAEINTRMPAPPNGPFIPKSRVDYVVPCERQLDPFPLVEPTEDAVAIGRNVASLVQDGDTIQTGVGAIPYAVLSQLTDKNDLGLHSGILDDAGMALATAGVITGKRKVQDVGKMVTGNAIGTQALYDWAGSSPAVMFRPFSYTHSAVVLAQTENFVSINSAMEIDFFGQVNSEMIKGRQITGTGGSVDFIRGCSAAKGGRSIVALTATAAGGKLSRIVPALLTGNAATALRTDVDYVITEFGIAHLRYLPLRERARALIEIAAPGFRDELRVQAKEMFG